MQSSRYLIHYLVSFIACIAYSLFVDASPEIAKSDNILVEVILALFGGASLLAVWWYGIRMIWISLRTSGAPTIAYVLMVGPILLPGLGPIISAMLYLLFWFLFGSTEARAVWRSAGHIGLGLLEILAASAANRARENSETEGASGDVSVRKRAETEWRSAPRRPDRPSYDSAIKSSATSSKSYGAKSSSTPLGGSSGMSGYSSNMKVCATCVKWGGPRVIPPGTRPFFVNADQYSKGMCQVTRAQHPPGASCSKYEKLPYMA